ncbi:MAG TPA: DUF1080 domain-containing protein [Chryseolinea sp.]|nr:DUF1080 domain-containing protein [Chryseolinea sp.]
MKIRHYHLFLFCFLSSAFIDLRGQALYSSKKEFIISAIRGTESRADTIELKSQNQKLSVREMKISGEHAAFFKIVSTIPKYVSRGKSEIIVVTFSPAENFRGIARATLEISHLDFAIPLTGLSTDGLEGEREAPLSLIVKALGYDIDLGWKTLAHNLSSTLQGEELAPVLFKKADQTKPVQMIPVARYSPDFPVHFGLYTNTPNGPRQHQNGVLAKANKYPEHQTLFPDHIPSTPTFDPKDKEFGFYAISPTHTVYSEDVWNMLLYPTHASHAVRIYPVRSEGKLISDAYLICMEEAANGDYNDYVFLVQNIKPVFLEQKFTALMNGKNLEGWYTWLATKGKNNDPEKIFTIEEGGILHDTGKEVGYIMTEKSFGNYHFKLEFKWGNDRWPPRQNSKRDSGICYNIPEDGVDMIWPQSVECQIQESDVGDFWLLGNSTIQVDQKQNVPSPYTQIVKKKDAEKPKGEWNTVEVISYNGKCVHIVNGVVVNYGENSSLVGGRILLQSEYAELYYRNVSLREL